VKKEAIARVGQGYEEYAMGQLRGWNENRTGLLIEEHKEISMGALGEAGDGIC